MAVLLDTSGVILVLRRHPPPETASFVAAARAEILGGRAVLPSVAVSELLVGERSPSGARRLHEALAQIPSVVLPVEAALSAGVMGSYLASGGASIPFPDLLVAATAVWLDLPLLTWDGDLARALAQGRRGGNHPGAQAWRRLRLHPASRSA